MARLGQFRRDTAANWEAANPIIADGEFILIATNPDSPKVYDAQKVGDGQTRYNDLPMRGFECVQELGISGTIPLSQWEATKGRAIAESLFGGITIIPNALCNLPGGGAAGYMVSSANWDCALIRIINPVGTLQISGAEKANSFCFWSDDFTDDGWLGSTSGAIPTNAKWCVIDFSKTDNPSGLKNLHVVQNGMAVEKAVFETNKDALYQGNTVKEKYLYPLVFRHDTADITANAEHIVGSWYNPNIDAISVNANFDSYKLDVSAMTGSILHVKTQGAGTMWQVAFADADNKHIVKYEYTNNGSNPLVDRYIQVPDNAKYLWVNRYVAIETSREAYIGTVQIDPKYINDYENFLLPMQTATRDGMGASGLLFIYPYTCYIYNTGGADNGRIAQSISWHLGVIRLQSKKGTLRISVGKTTPLFGYFSSKDFGVDTFLGANYSGEIPEGAEYAMVNFPVSSYSLEDIKDVVVTHEGTVQSHEVVLRKGNRKMIPMSATVAGKYWGTDNIEKTSTSFSYTDFPFNGEKDIDFSGVFSGTGVYIFSFMKNDGTRIGYQYQAPSVSQTLYMNAYRVNPPIGTDFIRINHSTTSVPLLTANEIGEYLDAVETVNEITEIQKDLTSYEDVELVADTIVKGNLKSLDGSDKANASFQYRTWNLPTLSENEELRFNSQMGGNTQMAFVYLYDAEDRMISRQWLYSTNQEGVPSITKDHEIIFIPEGATKIALNSRLVFAPRLFKRIYGDKRNFNEIEDVLTKYKTNNVTMQSRSEGVFVLASTGEERANANFHIDSYNVKNIQANEFFFSGGVGGSTTLAFINCYDKSGAWLGSLYPVATPSGGSASYTDQQVVLFEGTALVKMNSSNSYTTALKYKTKEGFFDLEKMEDDIEEIKNTTLKEKLMKVHVYGTSVALGSDLFYVRAKYNSTKDILVAYYTNNNGLVSPRAAYVGANTLTDAQLYTSTYLVSSHSDSTAPLFTMKEYWHLYAQHGYVIPVLLNVANMNTTDIGAKWKDQLDREYTIGNVIGTSVYLLPTFSNTGEGTTSRSWKAPTGTAISSLTHISGGTHTADITGATQSTVQLRPIMAASNRVFKIDGKSITEAGDYYCDDFNVSESQVGYDPASIPTNNWFPQAGVVGTPNLTGALEMARFTWSYNFKGVNCCVNTTIDIRRKVEAQSYGACQQQFFLDRGSYKAMFLIPKAAARNGVEIDKPFNSPATTSTGYTFFRNATLLKDVDKLVDRQIGYLYDSNTDDYLVGMAAGLSLVSGDTIEEKRKQNIAVSSGTDGHSRLGSLSPSNTNKFYIAAVNTEPFADDNYNFPNTYFKEINYYVSYFDPKENPGQVYWYKDGGEYVIYMHCQSAQDRVAITLPDFMEGLKTTIVEKTDGATLHTDTISNGKLFVSYTNEANYIVVRAK